MKAIILAAGFGSRLYPLTLNKPKSLLEIKEKNLIEYIIDKIPNNIEKIYIITNEKFYLNFVWWLQNYNNQKKKIIEIFSDGILSEENRRGGLGSLHYFLKNSNINDDLLIVLGDLYFDFNLEEFSKLKESSIGLVKIPINKAYNFGNVILGKNNEILEIEEKPKNPKSDLVVAGIYLIKKENIKDIFDYIEKGKNKEGLTFFFKDMIENNKKVLPFIFKGIWYDIGTMEDYEKLK